LRRGKVDPDVLAAARTLEELFELGAARKFVAAR
jgi:hypothetical protein